MTTTDTIEVVSNVVQVRMIKTIAAKPAGFHRTSIFPGQDQNAVFNAVNADFAGMGVDAMPASEWVNVQTTVSATHTPAVIAAYQAQIAASIPFKPGNVTAAPV